MIYSYIKTSIRGLLKNRIYAVVNVGGLALGMAACLVIFYYVAYELSYDKFFEESQSIHRFYLERDQQERSRVYFHLAPAFKPALEEVPGVRSAFRMIPLDYQNNSMVYEENGVKNIFQQQGINFADADIANTLGLKTLEGSFSALNEPSKMVISNRVAYKIFGDQQAIGKTVTLTGNVGAHDYEIVGIMEDLPGNTHFEFTVLLSMSTLEIIEGRGTTDSWEGWNTKVYVKGDLPGKELAAAIGQSILEKPIFQGDESVWRARLLPVGEHYLTVVEEDGSIDQSAKNLLLGLAFIGIFILVIGWINFINLSATRAMERAREVGIRKALGSHTYQLRWQFMIESLVINLCAAVLAFTVVQVALPYLRAIANPMTLPVEGQPLFWAVVFTLLTTGSLLAGLYPAFILSSFKPAVVLKGRVSPLGSGRFLRKGLVVFQFVASTCMIIATYVTYEQLMYMKNKDLGVKIDHTLLLDAPPGSLVEENTTFFESVNSFKEEVIQLNGVNQMTASSV
ncbi:MAG: ABC transporter permease, partial [Cytophagales bacterium]|nr:ABC transporter permease [Cytophagales bacterium]